MADGLVQNEITIRNMHMGPFTVGVLLLGQRT